jgi:glycosyltransferase involved in cell wall biosynthesis
MHVAYVCADQGVPVFGRKGASIHVQEVVRALIAQGADVELFAASLGQDMPDGLEAVPVHRLPVASGPDGASREQQALRANEHLARALDQQAPFDLIYERYSLWSFAGMELAREIGVPGLLEVNAPLIEEQADYRGLVDRQAAEEVAARAFGAATALVAVSQEVGRYLERYPDARGRVHVVPNGVNLERFPPRPAASYDRRHTAFTIAFVGSLKPWHGVPILVEAFAALHLQSPGARLMIVGEGPEHDKLAGDVCRRRLADAVHFTGWVPPSDLPALLASVDVAVAPYPELPHFYFSPLKVYEYMAAGLPVVASRVGQIAELIEDEVNGLLCPPGDASALAEAIDRLRREPEMRRRLGRAARVTISRDYTWDAIARRILSVAALVPTVGAHHREPR